ncbi:MAG: glycosyltransferase [Thermomicrobiales bacterium]|nr:glycosyltransferase [Thermomicrobiales bacterium]
MNNRHDIAELSTHVVLRHAYQPWNASPPKVSMILTTRDRPKFMEMALACFQHQTYPNRELIIVDDGDAQPVDEEIARRAGATLIRTPPGTPLGDKLNIGCDAATGLLCQKMDDDDWYGPDFEITMVRAALSRWTDACRPIVGIVTPFRFFNLVSWEVRQTPQGNVPGATLIFARQDWREHPFRSLPGDEDVWFFLDHLAHGAAVARVNGLQHYLAIRHRGLNTERGHTWVNQWTGQALEDDLLSLDLVPGGPESILPRWAIDFYQGMLISPPV